MSHQQVWDEIIYPYPYLYGSIVEVRESMHNLIWNFDEFSYLSMPGLKFIPAMKGYPSRILYYVWKLHQSYIVKSVHRKRNVNDKYTY